MGPLTSRGPGVYQIDVDGRTETVYVAGPAHDRWVFWKGRVFRGDFRAQTERTRTQGSPAQRALTAPMPATVVKVIASPGDTVAKGQILMVLEAMKMEIPIRAPQDAIVAAVRGRAGELVQADTVLVEFKP